MSDVNSFIDAVGKDVNGEVVPRIQKLAAGIGATALSDYGPKVSAFANQLVKEIVDEQSKVVCDFAASLIQDLFQRYRPEVAGDLRTKVVADGLEVVGEGVRLDLKHRDTGALVSSLDIPVSLKIKIDGLSLSITDTTISLDVIS
ncbi:MAG TPA: hypothetical protein VGG73_07250 [Vicinamibacterales bacterium]